IQWVKFGEFGGFRLEVSDDGGLNYVTLVNVNGTHWEMDGQGTGPGLIYFRFTPVSTTGVENAIARIIRAANIQGDLSAPDPPISVAISSHLLSVRVLVTLQNPVADDFASVEVEVWRTALDTGTMLEKNRYGASANRAATGTMNVECNFNLGARFPPEPYGSVIWARARAKDYSDNPLEGTPEYTSLQVDSGSTILTADPEAAGGGLMRAKTKTLVLNRRVQIYAEHR